MAHTDTIVNNLKINRGTYANIQSNLSSIGENELIITTDKGTPVPTTSDSGKVISVNSSGEYELTTPSAGTTYSAGTGISIASNTISNTGVAYLTTAPSSANTSGDLKFVVLDSEPVTRYDGYIYIITEPAGYAVTLQISEWGGAGNFKSYLKIYDGQNNTGTLLNETNGLTSFINPTTVMCSSGYLYIDAQCVSGGSMNIDVGPTCSTGITNTSNSVSGNNLQMYFTVTADGTITATINYDD